jgi:RNA recognition motif-containing protein
VLVINISPLTPNQQIRRHFGAHGRVVSFEPQIDKQTGGALGIVLVKFSTHEEAKKCVERENGGKNIGLGTTLGIQSVQGEVLKVVFDDDDKTRLKAVLKELDNRKRREKEEIQKKKRDAEAAEKRKKDEEEKSKKEAEAAQLRRGKQATDPRHVPSTEPHHHSLPPRPDDASPVVPSNESRPPPSLVRARIMNSSANVRYSSRPTLAIHDHSSSSTPLHSHRGRSFDRSSDRHYRPNYHRDRYSPSRRLSRSRSRSPSPISRKPGHSSRYSSRQSQRDVVMAELKRNGHDYVSVEEYGGGGQLGGGNVKEEDVRKFFDGFKVDKVRPYFTF